MSSKLSNAGAGILILVALFFMAWNPWPETRRVYNPRPVVTAQRIDDPTAGTILRVLVPASAMTGIPGSPVSYIKVETRGFSGKVGRDGGEVNIGYLPAWGPVTITATAISETTGRPQELAVAATTVDPTKTSQRFFILENFQAKK